MLSLPHSDLLLIDKDYEVLMLLLDLFANFTVEKPIDVCLSIVFMHSLRDVRDHQHFFLYLSELEVKVSMWIDINWHVLFYLIKRVGVLSVDEDVMRGVEETEIELIVKYKVICELSDQMVRFVDIV